MATLSLKKIVKETQGNLKSSKPTGLKESYWALLKEQAYSEGTWDDELLQEIKNKISASLDKYNKNQLKEIWDQTEVSLSNLVEETSIPISKLKEDISEDILNSVFDLLDDRSSDIVFESRFVENEDDEDNEFGSDNLGNFSDENEFGTDELDDEEKL